MGSNTVSRFKGGIHLAKAKGAYLFTHSVTCRRVAGSISPHSDVHEFSATILRGTALDKILKARRQLSNLECIVSLPDGLAVIAGELANHDDHLPGRNLPVCPIEHHRHHMATGHSKHIAIQCNGQAIIAFYDTVREVTLSAWPSEPDGYGVAGSVIGCAVIIQNNPDLAICVPLHGVHNVDSTRVG